MIDQYVCIEYLSKYVAKGESKSPMLAETFDMVLKTTNNNSEAKKLWKKIGMRTFGQRDFSAQKAMHLLLFQKYIEKPSMSFLSVCMALEK